MKVIDLFCGAGGFSLGAHLAGFQTVLAIDKDPTLTSSYKKNFPETNLALKDISAISGKEILRLAQCNSGKTLGIIGGPPCQGFSLIGKRSISDPRNSLLQHFFRLVSEIRPKFFVMENVPGLLAGEAKDSLDRAIGSLSGYKILGPLKLNAHDFGAATSRERVLVIGFSTTNSLTEKDILASRVSFKSTVKDAISDLPLPTSEGQGTYKATKELSVYAINARMIKPGLGSEEARRRISKGLVDGVLPTSHTNKVKLRFSKVPQGKSDSISRCPRLAWHLPSPTLRAGTGADHGSFQSIRPLHPEEDRVITVREGARLQGFPDWFQFHQTKWHSFRMIGNSVSPHMSAAVMRLVAKHL